MRLWKEIRSTIINTGSRRRRRGRRMKERRRRMEERTRARAYNRWRRGTMRKRDTGKGNWTRR